MSSSTVDRSWRPRTRDVASTPRAHQLANIDAPLAQVNAEIIKQLLEFGFSPNRAVRAAYFSGNSTVEGALNWLEEHAEDNDLDDELVVPKESATSKKKARTAERPPAKISCTLLRRCVYACRRPALQKLTKEELEQRLKRARELRAKQEKEADLNREKMRIRMGREIAEARRIEEDQARMRLQIERQKEREEKERAMAAVKAKLEADRRALRQCKEGRRGRLAVTGLRAMGLQKGAAAGAGPPRGADGGGEGSGGGEGTPEAGGRGEEVRRGGQGDEGGPCLAGSCNSAWRGFSRTHPLLDRDAAGDGAHAPPGRPGGAEEGSRGVGARGVQDAGGVHRERAAESRRGQVPPDQPGERRVPGETLHCAAAGAFAARSIASARSPSHAQATGSYPSRWIVTSRLVPPPAEPRGMLAGGHAVLGNRGVSEDGHHAGHGA